MKKSLIFLSVLGMSFVSFASDTPSKAVLNQRYEQVEQTRLENHRKEKTARNLPAPAPVPLHPLYVGYPASA